MAQPSLRNLQVFEVAARHRSFRAAAEELFLTHGAISRQVRALEAELGVDLFVRTGRRVVLTPQGQRLQEAVAEGLNIFAKAMANLKTEAHAGATRLMVTVPPAFAGRWLAPRMINFHAHHPDIQVELVATMSMLNLGAKQIQLGIRYGEGKWDGMTAERLARETLFPVAASKGIKGYANFPSSAHELLQYPLLNPYDEWERWFRRAGVIAPLPEAGRTFSDASALMAATERGVGVVLGRYWLVADALKAGTLVRLPGPAITASRTYYLIHPSGQPLTPNALTFVSWLRKVMTEKRT